MNKEHERAMRIVDLCREVIKHARRMEVTAPIDDDFPRVKHDFDCACKQYTDEVYAHPAPQAVAGTGDVASLIAELHQIEHPGHSDHGMIGNLRCLTCCAINARMDAAAAPPTGETK